MHRSISEKSARKNLLTCLWISAATVLIPCIAYATVEPPVYVRWSGTPQPAARAGDLIDGRFEIVAGAAGVVENLTLEGEGWSVEAFDARGPMLLSKGATRAFTFRARPSDLRQPLVVRYTFNGVPAIQALHLDEANAKPPALVHVNGMPPTVKRTTPRIGAQTIRLRGRLAYVRSDGDTLGVDRMSVTFTDDDSPFSYETMGNTQTNPDGTFDFTLDWEDCDLLGCDSPDIGFELTAVNEALALYLGIQVTPAHWPSGGYVPDYDGNDLDFGLILLPPASYTVGHIFTNVTRAHRLAAEAGMTAPTVAVLYPQANTSYNSAGQFIRISPGEEWNEGTQAHEFGHHLSHHFSVLNPPLYSIPNGFCDTPTPSHCVWCPENTQDAWQEGWADWYGSYCMRRSQADYGIVPVWINDNRYVLETPFLCMDGTAYPSDSTEGYVGMLLRDIEDPDNDGGPPPACDADVLTLGADEIFTVFTEDDPTSVTDFIAKFRARYPLWDQDLWSTALRTTSDFLFPVPPPVVVGPAGEACRVVRTGETIELHVNGNGRRLGYRWQRNGVNLFDGNSSAGWINGTQDSVLTLSSVTPALSGIYTCRVFSCDFTEVSTSLPVSISVQDAAAVRPLVSWGGNGSGQAGAGNMETPLPPATRPISPVVAASGGHTFSAALHANGTVSTWGFAGNGWELGNGYWSGTQTTASVVNGLDDVMQIATGTSHTLCLRRDGTVWGWGNGGLGQLGDGMNIGRYVPVQATEVEGCVRAIASGSEHTLLLMGDGTVLACGYNVFGQLGRGSSETYSLEVLPVSGLTDVVAVSASGYSSMAMKSDGTVWTWGYNAWGQLGDNTNINRSVPVQVSGLTSVRAIRMGTASAYAIKNDGSCWSWGSNQYRLLGDGNDLSVTHRYVPGLMPDLVNPLAIEVSGFWCLALMPDGTVRMWGNNDYSVLGRPAPAVVNIPTLVQTVDGVTPVMSSGIGVGFITAFAFGQTNTLVDAPPGDAPRVLALHATPNPSFAPMRLGFDLPQPGRVSLAIYDVAGRRVRELLNEFRDAGRYDIAWDGRGNAHAGSRLAGVFFARLELNGMTRTERLVRIP